MKMKSVLMNNRKKAYEIVKNFNIPSGVIINKYDLNLLLIVSSLFVFHHMQINDAL